MNSKQRFTTALNLGIPDRVPMFELGLHIEEDLFGKTYDYSQTTAEALSRCDAKKREYLLSKRAEHYIWLFHEQLEYDAISVNGPNQLKDLEYKLEFIRILRKMVGETACIQCQGDGTFSLGDGDKMCEFAYRIADDFDGMLFEAEEKAKAAVERNRRLVDAGVDVIVLGADVCYNSGPFISPKMFSQLIAPYMAMIIDGIRATGAYAIKHTDGNIMPIIDQLVAARPHALHSLDPMAGVDIKLVKEQYGGKVALCGNVNCALMQTGTDEQVRESAMYCLTHAKPGGGYIYCTSNVPFKGLPPERYRMILDIWKQHRDY